jgi:hypothetical protein
MDVNGFLYSQIGYDLGDPKRAIIRSYREDYVPEGATFEVPAAGSTAGGGTESPEPVITGDVRYWGAVWHAHWWVVDFSELEEPGSYVILIRGPGEDDAPGEELLRSETIEVGENLLWRETVEPIALDQLEERARRARNGIGWKDCGAEWREANSHATTLIGLCEVLSVGFEWLTDEQIRRLRRQIIHGCDYLLILQDAGEGIGAPAGALVHEIPNHLVLIPGDTAQAVVALAHAGRLLADTHPETSAEYIERAALAMDYLILEAEPYKGGNFSAMNHGAPEGFHVPDEFMTRDLAMMMWGCLQLFAAGKPAYKRHAARFAREVMARQVPEDRAEDGLYGHFYTFASADFTEKANCHHHVGHDTGTTFPHYISPMVDMARRWPDHPDAERWRACVKRFAEGYLIPACSRNPFYLLPEGVFPGEGLLSFCGPWHGINTSYGFAAALAAECENVSGDPRLRQIVVGNLQWFCGLNAGIISRSFDGCVIWHEELPQGEAIPYSQICGVGRRWTGNWTGIRGTVPNGFDVNPQFQLVVEPTKENDEPLLYTDEDWIPHGAGFLAGLTALRGRKRFER